MKKLICVVLVVVLLLNVSLSGNADGERNQIGDEDAFIVSVQERVTGILASIEPFKEVFGMGGIDFSDLTMGNEIPAYELTIEGLIPLDNISYFPIMCGNSWCASAVVSFNIFGEMIVDVSVKYAAEYQREYGVYGFDKPVRAALVFGRTDAYLYTDAGRVLVESCQEDAERADVSLYAGQVLPEMAPLLSLCTIDVRSHCSEQPNPQTDLNRLVDMEVLGVVPIVQPTDVSCWAACVAMAVNYYGESETPGSVATAAGSDLNSLGNIWYCEWIINSIYGYYCGINGLDTGSYTSLPLASLTIELKYYSSPLLAGFIYGSTRHMVVVMGYTNLNNLDPTMVYIDPADGYIKASFVPANGAVTISRNGHTYGLYAAYSVYESVE